MSNDITRITDLVPDFDKERYGFDVPDMPLVDNKMDPDYHQGNWLWVHYDSTNHNDRNETSLEAMPARLTDAVYHETTALAYRGLIRAISC